MTIHIHGANVMIIIQEKMEMNFSNKFVLFTLMGPSFLSVFNGKCWYGGGN